MTRLKAIVAATDLSAASKHACERAAQLAATANATLTLMHTLGATALDDLRRWIGEDPQARRTFRCHVDVEGLDTTGLQDAVRQFQADGGADGEPGQIALDEDCAFGLIARGHTQRDRQGGELRPDIAVEGGWCRSDVG